MEIYLYSLKKRKNSTFRPGLSETAEYTPIRLDAVLLDGCSINKPSLGVGRWIGGYPTRQNYVYIPEFDRYYFVNDITADGANLIYNCECDVLASFKEDIAGSRQMVERCSAVYNERLTDTLYPAENCPEVIEAVATSAEWVDRVDINNALYVVGSISANAEDRQGGTSFYLMNHLAFTTLINFLYNKPDQWLNISEFSESLTKALVNPAQYITSCRVFPVIWSDVVNKLELTPDDSVSFKFGWWSTPNAIRFCYPLFDSGILYQVTETLNIPRHPQSFDYGDYLNHAPFSFHTLHIPSYGTVSLDPSIICTRDVSGKDHTDIEIRIEHVFDLCSGECIIRIKSRVEYTDEWRTIMTLDTHPAADLALGQIAISPEGYATSAITHAVGGAISGLFSGTRLGDFLGNATTTIASANEMAQTTATIKGGNTSFAKFGMCSRSQSVFYRITPPAPELFGRPCNEYLQIGVHGVGTFYHCSHAEISSNVATADELNEIKRQMLNGFYYE